MTEYASNPEGKKKAKKRFQTIEVSLKGGELNSLILTTVLRVNWNNKHRAIQEIRESTQVLMRAMPNAELKGLDLEHGKIPEAYISMPGGGVVAATSETASAAKLLDALRKGEKRHAGIIAPCVESGLLWVTPW